MNKFWCLLSLNLTILGLENAHVELTKEVDSMKKSIEYPTNENLRKVRKKCKKVLKENENSKKNEESFLNDDKMKDVRLFVQKIV